MIIKTAAGEANLSSPFEIFTYYLEIPPVKRDHVLGAARFCLRSLHPGDPLTTQVDVRSAAVSTVANRQKETSLERIVAHATLIQEIKDNKPSDERPLPLIPGYALLAAGFKEYQKKTSFSGDNVMGLLITDEWIQCTHFKCAFAIAGTAITAPLQIGPDNTLSLEPFSQGEDLKGLFVLNLSNSENLPILDLFGYMPAISISASHIISRINLSTERLFKPKRSPVNRVTRTVLTTLILINLLAIAVRLERTATAWEIKATNARQVYETQKRATTELITLTKELAGLHEQTSINLNKFVPDVYAVFSNLARLLPNTAITSFSLQKDLITFTASTGDALSSVARLRGDAFFSDVQLVQVVTVPDGGEIFTVSGRVQR